MAEDDLVREFIGNTFGEGAGEAYDAGREVSASMGFGSGAGSEGSGSSEAAQAVAASNPNIRTNQRGLEPSTGGDVGSATASGGSTFGGEAPEAWDRGDREELGALGSPGDPVRVPTGERYEILAEMVGGGRPTKRGAVTALVKAAARYGDIFTDVIREIFDGTVRTADSDVEDATQAKLLLASYPSNIQRLILQKAAGFEEPVVEGELSEEENLAWGVMKLLEAVDVHEIFDEEDVDIVANIDLL